MGTKKINLAELTAKYVGKPFSEYSCWELTRQFYSDLGIDFPKEFEEYTIENYFEKLHQNEQKGFNAFLRFMDTIGEPCIDLKMYDMVAIQDINKNIYVGIYLHTNLVLVSNIHMGVRVSHLGEYNTVVKSRRLLCPKL